ncbi:Cyclin-like F-box domain containing protein [Dorcoceras hygrometricum]|uniref:Cyclin-like F-box domain containing protein n=1 Tax=Dorcoceras hygrometricum TaxID=472368 RepID=A0A2Z6ZSX0_9LAMI|nr:Cyclin-like F-box domain containing protein [Dorcoceras hygrometricum]
MRRRPSSSRTLVRATCALAAQGRPMLAPLHTHAHLTRIPTSRICCTNWSAATCGCAAGHRRTSGTDARDWCDGWPLDVALLVDACWRCGETMGGRCTLLDCVQNVARWSRRCAAQCPAMRDCAALVARKNRGGCAAGRPPLRRCSGDVVTAGLISSRVWFGPVPGSP